MNVPDPGDFPHGPIEQKQLLQLPQRKRVGAEPELATTRQKQRWEEGVEDNQPSGAAAGTRLQRMMMGDDEGN